MTIPTRAHRAARSASAQRLNVGLTPLALIFLIVMAAAAGVRASRPPKPVEAKTETLAVLGVTPSSGTAATLSSAAPSGTAPSGTTPGAASAGVTPGSASPGAAARQARDSRP